LAVTSFVRENSFEVAGVSIIEHEPTITRTPTATIAPIVIGTATSPIMQSFKSVGLGFSIDFPYGWRRYEEALHVKFSPTLKGLETASIVDSAIWAGVSTNEEATPADVLTEILTNFPQNAELIAQKPIAIAGLDWRSIQIKFDQEDSSVPIIAIIAAIRHDNVGYFVVLISPADKWDVSQPIFQEAVISFDFIKQVEVRLLREDELPPTPTATATPVIYVVQSGDSFGRIAGIYGVSIQTLAEENDLKLSDYLRVGQELIIPIGYDD
jgi:hypothetical protein